MPELMVSSQDKFAELEKLRELKRLRDLKAAQLSVGKPKDQITYPANWKYPKFQSMQELADFVHTKMPPIKDPNILQFLQNIGTGIGRFPTDMAAFGEQLVTKPVETTIGFGKSLAGGLVKTAALEREILRGTPLDPILSLAEGISKKVYPITKKPLEGQKKLASETIEQFKTTPVETAMELGTPLAMIMGGIGKVGGGFKTTPKLSSVEQYVQELTGKQKTARTMEDLGAVVKSKNFLNEAKKKLVDFNAPIEDVLRTAQSKGKYEVLPEYHITNQIDRALRPATPAGQFAIDYGLDGVMKKTDNLNNLDQYLIAKQAKAVEARGIKTGRNLAKDEMLIDEFAPRYEKTAKIINDYSRKLLDYSVDAGLVSKDLAQVLKERYPDYVPINRIFNELEKSGQFGTKAIASLSKQTIVQKLVGSERQIESPLKSLFEKTADAFRQGEKNKAARMLAGYRNLPDNPFEITPLRTAENVKARIDIYKELGLSKPIKVKLERLVQTGNRWARRIQTELNQLNREGIEQYLKRKPVEELSKQQGQLVSTKKVEIGKFEGDVEKFTAPYVSERTLEFRNEPISVKDTKAFVNELINEPPEKIVAIRKKIGLRDVKLSRILNEVDVLRGTLNEVKLQRSQLFDEARLLKDAESRGKSTFSVLNDGIKEIYETTPDITNAAKCLNVQQLNILGRIFALPVRIARIGITGINPAFLSANIAKDQVTGVINSNHALRTSIANPAVFGQALFEAVKHGDVYKEMARQGAIGTSFDIARNEAPLTIARARAGRTVAGKIGYTVRHPSELLRAVENIVNRGEETTRIQQYIGTEQALLKQGMSPERAKIGAARAAREGTVNFARRGEWGQVLNSAFLYINANIQGTRTFVRNFKTRPIQTATKIALVVFTPVAATTAWNLVDPKRKEAYDDIAEYEKQNNIIIVPPNPTKNKDGTWNIIKIPLSQEINNIASLARRPIEQAFGLDPVSVGDIASAFVGTVSPIAPTTSSITSTLTPQAIKPAIEWQANRTLFTGQPQVPQSMEKISPELQAKPYTSGTARQIGKGLKLSPIKIEAFIKGTLGGVGSQVLNASDQILAGMDIIPKDQIGGQNVVKAITARFATARGGYADEKSNKILEKIIQHQADDRFRLKQEAEILFTEFKKLPTSEASLKAQQIKEKSPALYEKLKDVVNAEKLGLSYNDRLIMQLGVENGERAKFIWESVKAFPTNEEKDNYIKDLRRKTIISDRVFSQLKQLKALQQ